MNRYNLALCFLALLFFTAIFAGNTPPTQRRSLPTSLRTSEWCVAKNGLPVEKAKSCVELLCSSRTFDLDCSSLIPGEKCYFEKNYTKQASYALNLYYVQNSTCYSECGTFTDKDPSEGSCHFNLHG